MSSSVFRNDETHPLTQVNQDQSEELSTDNKVIERIGYDCVAYLKEIYGIYDNDDRKE